VTQEKIEVNKAYGYKSDRDKESGRVGEGVEGRRGPEMT
jgi:hypothetical protein